MTHVNIYGFGNTEEDFRVQVYGTPRIGRKRDGPFDHSTGRGWVRRRRGSYFDAIHNKRSRVTLILCESTGAVSPRTLSYVYYCSRRARGKHARDGTKYGRSRMSTRSFYTHHTQRLSFAAAVGDVMGISKEIRHTKQRLCGIALPSVAA